MKIKALAQAAFAAFAETRKTPPGHVRAEDRCLPVSTLTRAQKDARRRKNKSQKAARRRNR